jgi:catechol 2,3-dioxygenase-like lactoylglutathione lyase family enzyme
MLSKHPIVAFVATNNAAAARGFYENTLGLTVLSEDDYACRRSSRSSANAGFASSALRGWTRTRKASGRRRAGRASYGSKIRTGTLYL